MIHKNRANRRYQKAKKVQKRMRMLDELGTRGGTIFEKNVDKVLNKSGNYMAKGGNYTHYGNKSHYGPKTRGDEYGPAERWKASDKRKIDQMDYDEDEF